MSEIILTPCQQLAEVAVRKMLASDSPGIILSGPAGVGKTFFLNYITSRMDHYNLRASLANRPPIDHVHYAATTNKAAALLPNGRTLPSLLGLRLHKDPSKPKRYLVQARASEIHSNSLTCVDESYMIGESLGSFIDSIPQPSKIIYLGDEFQLKPIDSRAIIEDYGYQKIELLTPVRQQADTPLYRLCIALREGVRGQRLTNIIADTDILMLDDAQADTYVRKYFTRDNGPNDIRLLAYTNERVIAYNNYIRELLGFKNELEESEVVVINNHVYTVNRAYAAKVETTTKVIRISTDVTHVSGIPCKVVHTLEGSFFVALTRSSVEAAIKEARYERDWSRIHDIEDSIADMRPMYASTVHKAQGSTFDRTLIDLNDFARCLKYDFDMYLRLLYVATSRSRHEVAFYGKVIF